MPTGFEWSNIDFNDKKQVEEVYEFLRDNYVEDSDNTFRFDYPVDFLKWALLVPGQQPDWLLGVRYGKKRSLYGFISAIPVSVQAKT